MGLGQQRLLGCFLLGAVWLGSSGIGHGQALPPYSALFGGGLTTLPGLNDAQQTMAQSINNVCPTISTIAITPSQKDLAGVCQAMIGTAIQLQNQPNPLGLPSYGIGAGTLSSALQSLNGGDEIVVPTSQASALTIQQSNLMGGVVEARLSMLRHPNATPETAGLPSLGRLAQAASPYLSDGYASPYQPRPVTFSYQTGGFGVYANGIGQFGDRGMSSRENGFSFNNTGVVVGADYRWTPQFASGLAFSYTHANTDFDVSALSPSGQSIKSDLFQGTIYATYSISDSFYLDGNAMIGGGSSDSRRHIVIPSTTDVPAVDRFATGSFGIANDSINIGAGYILPFGAFTLTPTARFQYLRVSSDRFAEQGASGLDLTFGGSGHNSYLSFLGGQAQYAIPTPFGTLYPSGRFEWAHQFNSANSAVSVAYSNDPLLLSTFVLPADKVDRNYFDLGAGLALQLSPTQSAFVSYDTILGLSHTTYNSFIAGVRITF